MQLVERDTFHICGWAVTTTAENNDRDISALYDDFFRTGKEVLVRELSGSQPGYFGLSWYTDDHHGYSYLLGVKASASLNLDSNGFNVLCKTQVVDWDPGEKDDELTGVDPNRRERRGGRYPT